MNYSTTRLTILFSLAIIANLLFSSFPVFAASHLFSFIEFNIAFVLGLSLPVLLLVFVITPLPAINKCLPILLTITLLILLYLLNYFPQDYGSINLILSALILQTSCYWSLNYKAGESVSTLKLIVKNSIFILLLCLFVFLLFSELVSSQMAWLIFASVQMLTVLSYIRLMHRNSPEIKSRLINSLTVNVFFAISVYFWFGGHVSLNAFVGASVLTYLLTMANACWYLVNRLTNKASESKALSAKSAFIESYDPVTNLPNYQYALSLFEHSLKLSASARYAVIVFKPTNFQQVNSVLGHHNSDILLLQLAYSLQQSIVSHDELLNFSEQGSPVRLARLQGLHFLVAVDMSQNKHSDEIVIEKLCKELVLAVPEPMSFKSFSSFFTLAFGVAFVGKSSNNVSEVIAHAEDALLQAEQQHKQVSFFNEELAIFNIQQLQKMEQLKHAIQDNTLQWTLQPQIKLKSKRIMAFEMQVTWQRKSDELLDLAKIMSIAEQSGDAYALSRKMVDQTFKSLVELKGLNTLVPIAIKLTGDSLLEPDLVEYIEQQSLLHDVDCQFLLVEVHEAILLKASPQAKASIDQLKSLGINIVIDEFSGSYEALRYIRRLAISGIKIDCHMLANTASGSSDKAIINALITLTRKMDLPLIGTNINALAIEEMFIAMGGEHAQGKHYSNGVNTKELPHWLAAWQKQY